MGKRPNIVGIIFARGGSKGLPRKNIRPLAGKPLIAWAVEAGLASPSLSAVVVSTDDAEIAAVAREFGAETPFVRPAELASDTSAEWESWKHALENLDAGERDRPDILVSLPATAPLKTAEDIEACLSALLGNDQADIAITVTPAHRNPWFNMVTLEDGWAQVVMADNSRVVRRQDAPDVYDITTVAYAARASYIRRADHPLEGKVCATIVPIERSVDIDTMLDFEYAEFLLQRRKGESA